MKKLIIKELYGDFFARTEEDLKIAAINDTDLYDAPTVGIMKVINYDGIIAEPIDDYNRRLYNAAINAYKQGIDTIDAREVSA